MTRHTTRRALAALTLAAATVGGLAVGTLAAAPASAAGCADVDVVFARGTSEAPGLGMVGAPFVSAVAAALPGRTVTSYAVVYGANLAQTSAAAGSADLVAHVTDVAAACPGTRFVLGGYSQGGTVVDKALGIRTGLGGATVLPAALSGRVAAVVAYGNTLGAERRTIAGSSPTYGSRAQEYCNAGDPICGGGVNFFAHLTYGFNGTAVAGGRFAAARV